MLISAVRTVILFAVLTASVRLLGKRQLGELEPNELVVAVLLSDLAATPLQHPGTPLLYGLVPVATLLFCELLVSGLLLRHIRLRTLVCGKPDMIVYEGNVCQREMLRNRLTVDELLEELRRQSILDLRDVDYAVLEANGSLSVVPKPQSPAPAGRAGYPVLVVNNGRVLSENLRHLKRDEAWLRRVLNQYGVSDSAGVFLMTADQYGNVNLVKKEAAP